MSHYVVIDVLLSVALLQEPSRQLIRLMRLTLAAFSEPSESGLMTVTTCAVITTRVTCMAINTEGYSNQTHRFCLDSHPMP